MSGSYRYYLLAAGLVVVCGLVFVLALLGPGLFRILSGSVAPTPDFEATLQALVVEATASSVPATAPAPNAGGAPTGRIVYTCQIYKLQSAEQICLMNADGSDPRQLTEDAGVRHYYPSMGPEGDSVVYSQYREDNVYEIYELSLEGGPMRLTDRLGVLTGPEISPDGRLTPLFQRKILGEPEKYKYSFRNCLDSPSLVGYISGLMREINKEFGFNKVFIITQDVLWATATGGLMDKWFKDNGWTVLGFEKYPTGASDFSSGLMKARSGGAQVILPVFDMPTSGVLVKQWQGMKVPAMMGGFISPLAGSKAWQTFEGEIEGAMNVMFEIGHIP